MTLVRDEIIEKLWRGRDPFRNFPADLFEKDTQGWGSGHPYLSRSVVASGARIIVEVGVWKGGSVITMASKLREAGMDGAVIAVDTWLGSSEHWLDPKWFDHLLMDHGYPMINRKFMANIVANGLQDYVVPLPLDSSNAARVLARLQLKPDMVHIDGAHDREGVLSDLSKWWPPIVPGGVLIGDDYYPEKHWQGVRVAFDEYFGNLGLFPFEFENGKCLVKKPL